MEDPTGKEPEKKLKSRLMGKLFKEKKAIHNDNDNNVDDFLHGPSDKLHMMPASASPSHPPPLTRIDTASARRWPTAAEIQSSNNGRGRSASPKRSRKGLVVRFTEGRPDIIGEGGDEATSPVSDIGMRKRAQSHPQGRQPAQNQTPPSGHRPFLEGPRNTEDFRPSPIQRVKTGFDSIPDQRGSTDDFTRSPGRDPKDGSIQTGFLRTEQHNPTSFAARVKADMKAGEGKALLQASLQTPINHLRPGSSEASDVEITPQLRELHLNTVRNSMIASSPGIPPLLFPGPLQTPTGSLETTPITDNSGPLSRPSTLQSAQQPSSNSLATSPMPPNLSQTSTLQGAAIGVGDEALHDFSSRVAHLFTLFRLSAESVKPFPKCSLEELVRAALWWFLKGRMNLEATVRDRPANPETQQASASVRQQAYADLGKSLFIIETGTPQHSGLLSRPRSDGADPYVENILETSQTIMSSLRKLAMSMKRNGFLPPSDAPLPQGLDNTIWVRHEGNQSLVASQRSSLMIKLSDAFPLGDSSRSFHYGRMFVDGVLEEEAASEHYRCPLLVSLVRDQKEQEMTAVVGSQDGSLKFYIQDDKTRGPIWDDVTWQPKTNSLKIELPRGFVLRLLCSEHDYKTIWGIYDYQNKIHASLLQRRNEELIFETTLKTFRYIDENPGSRFPKDPLPNCCLRVFERSLVEKAATGMRTMHRGFRIALNTNPKTKSLRGIDQDLSPSLPTQFGFLRGEDGQPALLLKIDTAKSKYKMVLSFDNPNERVRLHELLTGAALRSGEDVVAEALMKASSMACHDSNSTDISCLKTLDWNGFRIINEYNGDVQGTKTVLSEHLRVILDFKTGSLTDRINVGPGELKIRLDVKSSKELKVLRAAQEDMTISVVESQVSQELPHELAELLGTIGVTQSTRTYLFPGTQDLHSFQAALTGFAVLYDGMASSFNISRRRMVVPIYKKWDAATTRLQIVQREKVVQLVAFFENFSHGDCMNFALKSTDIFETSGRNGKFSLRIVDAKFAMPKSCEGEEGVGHEFVCLDMPEYPGEHDDITIVFDTESEREKFAEALPAPTKVASRMGSVRR